MKAGETYDGIGLTYRQIAARLGISHTRVQQLEARALVKMAKLARARGIRIADVLQREVP